MLPAAERRADAANAQIGIAIAAYYPTINLTGTGGFESKAPTTLIQGPSALWSLGGSAAELLFDAGRRHALTEEARDVYEQNVANYRQTVLQAFQEVEDNLSGLRILNSESVAQQRAVDSAQRSLGHFDQPLQGRCDHLSRSDYRTDHAAIQPAHSRGHHYPRVCRQRAAHQGTGWRLGHHQVAHPLEGRWKNQVLLQGTTLQAAENSLLDRSGLPRRSEH